MTRMDASMITPAELADWTRVAAAAEIAVDAAFVLALKPPVAVFHIEDGFYATDDTCTHAEFSLGEGYVEDGTVECELHAARFDIKTGQPLGPPAAIPLRTYPAVVVDGVVYVDLRDRTGCAVEQLKRS